MWICPNCDQKFYNRNQQHECADFGIEDFVKGKSPQAVQLFYAFLERFFEAGPYELQPAKSRVTLTVKTRFAAINKLGDDYLDGHLVLDNPNPNESVIYKIENLPNRSFLHHFRIYHPDDINDALMHLMQMAYKVGLREYVKPPMRQGGYGGGGNRSYGSGGGGNRSYGGGGNRSNYGDNNNRSSYGDRNNRSDYGDRNNRPDQGNRPPRGRSDQ